MLIVCLQLMQLLLCTILAAAAVDAAAAAAAALTPIMHTHNIQGKRLLLLLPETARPCFCFLLTYPRSEKCSNLV